MATTTTSNLEASQRALGIYFDSVVIESLQPNLYFEQFGEVENVPQGNYTSRFFTFNPIATSQVVTLTEGTGPTPIAVSVNGIDITPTQYGVSVEMTDLVVLTSAFELSKYTLSEVGKAMARKIDTVIQTVVNAGTNVIYAAGRTSRAALQAGDNIDVSLFFRAAQKLRANSAPEFAGGGYVAVIHPNVGFDLMNNTNVGQWIDIHKYAQPTNIFKGEKGSIGGLRIVETSNVQTFSSTVTVYPTTVLGAGAYRIAYWLAGKVNNYVYLPEQAVSINNQLGQKGWVGSKTNMGVARTQEERIVRIESAATAL